jgi:hypothetical protein
MAVIVPEELDGGVDVELDFAVTSPEGRRILAAVDRLANAILDTNQTIGNLARDVAKCDRSVASVGKVAVATALDVTEIKRHVFRGTRASRPAIDEDDESRSPSGMHFVVPVEEGIALKSDAASWRAFKSGAWKVALGVATAGLVAILLATAASVTGHDTRSTPTVHSP